MNGHPAVPHVFAVMPLHTRQADCGAISALVQKAKHPKGQYMLSTRMKPESLLDENFNDLWCAALNAIDRPQKGIPPVTHFAMVHSDVEPENFWLDKLMVEQEACGADVLSVVIPVKSDQDVSSTAIGYSDDPWKIVKQFSMEEIYELPETFDAESAGYPGHPLLVNTGCWIAKLSGDWCRELIGNVAAFAFNSVSRIVWSREEGWHTERGRSEDWEMSRHLFSRGVKVMATRKIHLHHHGNFKWKNYRDKTASAVAQEA
jgi:hypothetical protein